MARLLNFLGFTIDLGNVGPRTVSIPSVPQPSVLPGHCNLRQWQVAIANGMITADRIWLDYGTNTSVVLGVTLPISDDGTTISLQPGSSSSDFTGRICWITKHLQDMPASNSIKLDTGPFAITGDFEQGAVVVDGSGRLAVRMPTVSSPAFGWIAPIALQVSDDASSGLIYLDLGAGQMSIGEGAYTLATSTVIQSDDTYVAAFQIHSLRGQDIDLANFPTKVDLHFRGAADPLNLHTERLPDQSQPASATDPLYVAIRATQYDLVLSLALGDDGNRRATGLKLLSAGGPAATTDQTLQLITYGMGDVLNAPVTWRLADPSVEVQLLMRWGNAFRPSALMLAPTADALGVTPTIDLVPEGLPDARLHGEITDALVNLTASTSLRAAVTPKSQVYFPPGTVPGNLADQFDLAVLAEATTPYITWTSPGVAFARAKPGQAYRQDSVGAPSQVETYQFGGAPLALPALPFAHIDAVDEAYSESFKQRLDALMSGLVAPIDPVVHETARHEGPVQTSPTVGLSHVFGKSGAPSRPYIARDAQGIPPPVDALQLASFEINHIFNILNQAAVNAPQIPLAFKVKRPANSIPDFIIAEASGSPDQVAIPALSFTIATNNVDIVLDPSRAVSGIPPGTGGTPMPLGVIKLSRTLTIGDILRERDGYEAVAQNLEPNILAKDWVGVILFGVPVMPGGETILKKLVPLDVLQQLKLDYLAATPSKSSNDTDTHYSISAYLNWKRTDSPGGPLPDDRIQEASFYLKSIIGRWDQTTLQSLTVDTRLTCHRFVGLQNSSATEITILGVYDRVKNALKFSSHLNEPVGLLPEENVTMAEGPIQQIWFKGAVLSSRGQCGTYFNRWVNSA